LEGPLSDEIEKYVEDFKIRELLAKIPLRLELDKKLSQYDSIDTYKLDDIRKIYAKVIPLISTSGQVPHPSIQKHIDYFQDLALQETDNNQQEMIRQLDLKVKQQQ
jgi:hypothetical protein